MGALLAVLGAVALLVAVPAFVALLGGGLWRLATAHQTPSPRHGRAQGVVMLTAAGALAVVPMISVPIAESMNQWSDEDDDGMLDGFSNGAYDWVDLNGGDWFRVAGFFATVILVATHLLLRWLREAEGSADRPKVPWRRRDWPDPWEDHPLNDR